MQINPLVQSKVMKVVHKPKFIGLFLQFQIYSYNSFERDYMTINIPHEPFPHYFVIFVTSKIYKTHLV